LASGDFFGHIFLVKLAIKQPTTQPSPQTISVIGLIPDKSGLPSQTMRIYQKEPKSTFRCTKNFKEGIIFKRKKVFTIYTFTPPSPIHFYPPPASSGHATHALFRFLYSIIQHFITYI